MPPTCSQAAGFVLRSSICLSSNSSSLLLSAFNFFSLSFILRRLHCSLSSLVVLLLLIALVSDNISSPGRDVVDDFGRANPNLLGDDFAFELGSSLLTKERYLRANDLSALREACGDTLRVAASDFRIDPGDDEAVLYTLSVSGVQSAPYAGLEDKDPLKGQGPWKTLPTCGRCAFDAIGKCYSATLGAPLDRSGFCVEITSI